MIVINIINDEIRISFASAASSENVPSFPNNRLETSIVLSTQNDTNIKS